MVAFFLMCSAVLRQLADGSKWPGKRYLFNLPLQNVNNTTENVFLRK